MQQSKKSAEKKFDPLPKTILGRYNVLEKLGEGTYGKVYKVYDPQTENIYAIKYFKIVQDYSTYGFPATTLREISALKSLKHKNIVELVEMKYERIQEIYMVFEFIPINLHQYIETKKKAGEYIEMHIIQQIMKQLLQGLHYIHTNRYLHRDLKPLNILITASGQIKIADFGLSRLYIPCPRNLTREVATLWYRAPEVILGDKNYTYELDIWGAGVIFIELLLLKSPFRGGSEMEMLFTIFEKLGAPNPHNCAYYAKFQNKLKMLPRVEKGNLEKQLSMLCPEGMSLLMKMIALNPRKRIAAFEALEHPFFSLNFKEIGQKCHTHPE